MSSGSEFAEQMTAIRKVMDPEVLAGLRQAHDVLGFDCGAHGEGLSCCMDWLFSDDGPELHQISEIAAHEMRES